MAKTKAACYVRTSTDREEQEGSFILQKEYFINMIKEDPELEFVGCYGDYGKSGRFAEKRPEFQKMIRDCEAGKIEVIYTKSVSRFARNIADLVEVVQKLRSLGVCVYFERECLNTMDRSTELLLHILGIIAQEESRSYGENVRLGFELRHATGHPTGQPPYGYRRLNKDADWGIMEEEAKRIRLAFRMAAGVHNGEEISAALNEMEKAEGTDTKWTPSRVYRMLRHEAFKGDVLTGKRYVINGKSKPNDGQRPSYYLEGHHEPIVTREVFDRVRRLSAFKNSHYKCWRRFLTPEEKEFVADESWKIGQEALEASQAERKKNANGVILPEGGKVHGRKRKED